ncbi:hypothetical protein TorRG33x02_314560 [Trema orientale]|uniref:Ulp1 protease family, C-terminal catalytic domain containing protein n=1 Tax=Trema orientale TaxID=63057 RepID=A0A2P5BNN1_TREOI|nr:hypothetical protein TorRG33x02_314560 [Trema orientale]
MANDAHTDVDVTIHAEPTTEDALRLSPSRRSSPLLRNDILIPNPPRPEERPSENLFSEIKAYIEHRLSLVESLFRSEIALLKSDVARIESKFNGDHGEIKVEQQVETEEQPGQQQSGTVVQQQPKFAEQPIQQPRQEPTLVRKRKPSHYISSPYTNPCRKTRYHHDKKLVYTPLWMIPKEKAEAFEKYLKSKGHMEEVMFGTRKRQQNYPDVIKQDSIILDDLFSQLALSNFTTHPNTPDEAQLRYIAGLSPNHWGRPWKGARKLYIILNLRDKYWVTVKANLEAYEIVVFDNNNIEVTIEKNMDEAMLPLCTMILVMLKIPRDFQHIVDHL